MTKPGIRAGFSLIEAVVATGLLAVVLLSVGALFLHGLRIHTQTEEVMCATNILRHETDMLRSRPWIHPAGVNTLTGIRELACGHEADGSATTPEGGVMLSATESTAGTRILRAASRSSFTPHYDYRSGESKPSRLTQPEAVRDIRLVKSSPEAAEADRAEITLTLKWGPTAHRRQRTATLIIDRDGLLAR